MANFLKWFDAYKQEPAAKEMLNILVEGHGTEAEKVQFIRDEMAAGKK